MNCRPLSLWKKIIQLFTFYRASTHLPNIDVKLSEEEIKHLEKKIHFFRAYRKEFRDYVQQEVTEDTYKRIENIAAIHGRLTHLCNRISSMDKKWVVPFLKYIDCQLVGGRKAKKYPGRTIFSYKGHHYYVRYLDMHLRQIKEKVKKGK